MFNLTLALLVADSSRQNLETTFIYVTWQNEKGKGFRAERNQMQKHTYRGPCVRSKLVDDRYQFQQKQGKKLLKV